MDSPFIACIITLLLCLGVNNGKESNSKPNKPREVIIVGGGLAGMAAARALLQHGDYTVKVLEARKSRYGGRIWTKRSIGNKVKGAEAEMGAWLLNTRVKNNPLIKLCEKFELPTKNAGSLQVHVPEENLIYSGDNATRIYSEAFKILLSAIHKVKSQDLDVSIQDAVEMEWEKMQSDQTDESVIREILKTIPFPQAHNFSALLYDAEADMGWDRIVLDGLDTLLDRIVAGEGMEKPIKVELNKVVRNIQVDEGRKKVLVRTMDRKQAEADAVIVAVPPGVLKRKDIIFEPQLPKTWYQAIHDLGIYSAGKVIVEFEKVFWPKDVGSFSIFSTETTGGFLQMWTNLYRLTGSPYLAGNVFGDSVIAFEKMSDKELKHKVTSVLSQLFGADNLKQNKIKFITHTKWVENKFTLGCCSYPRVGNSVKLWETLKQPVCPYIYFAGAYTEASSHFGSMHFAYNSGVRAANQLIDNICQIKKDKKSKKKNVKSSKEEL